MNRTHFRCASVLCVLLVVTGCVSTTPRLDSHFGEGVNMVKAQQTLNPDASSNTEPVTGMDGRTAKSAYEEYQNSYKTPVPQPSAFTIGIGSAR